MEEQQHLGRAGEDYCALYGSQHTMCLSEEGDACKKMEIFKSVPFGEKDKAKMVDIHNKMRRKVRSIGI